MFSKMPKKNIFFSFFVFLLMSSCGLERKEVEISPEKYVMNIVKDNHKNRFIHDSLSDKFRPYSLDELIPAKQAYEVCKEFISSHKELDFYMRNLVFSELLATADSRILSTFDTAFSQTSLAGNSDYITGTVLYFIEPTKATVEVAKRENDTFLNSEDYKKYVEMTNEIHIAAGIKEKEKKTQYGSFDKGLEDVTKGKYILKADSRFSSVEARAIIVCAKFDLYLGLLGTDTYTKRMADNVSSVFSTRTRRAILEKYGN